MTMKGRTNNVVSNTVLMEKWSSQKGKGFVFTFVSAIELRLADECWTVAHIAAQEGIGRVSVAAAHVALHVLPAATVVALIATVISTEER